MNRGLSLYLDAMRTGAALVVFASHFAYERFTGGAFAWIRNADLGSDAVIVFFVMSGFLIAHAARRSGPSDFAKARIARLYSVALPAIALTLALDAAGRATAPDLYAPPWDEPGSPILEVLRSATFTNEVWFDTSRLGSNGPYWSLAYEAWYYALFAVFMYARGALRVALLIAGAAFIGPRILLLAPCWIIGVLLYGRMTTTPPAPASKTFSFGLILAPIIAYGALHVFDAPHLLRAATAEAVGASNPVRLFGYSVQFLWSYTVAGLVAAHLYGVIRIAHWAADLPAMPARIVRWPAQRSFGLYLYHYPILSFLAAWSPFDRHSLAQHGYLFVGALALSFALAEVTERRLSAWRRWTESVWTRIEKFLARLRKLATRAARSA